MLGEDLMAHRRQPGIARPVASSRRPHKAQSDGLPSVSVLFIALFVLILYSTNLQFYLQRCESEKNVLRRASKVPAALPGSSSLSRSYPSGHTPLVSPFSTIFNSNVDSANRDRATRELLEPPDEFPLTKAQVQPAWDRLHQVSSKELLVFGLGPAVNYWVFYVNPRGKTVLLDDDLDSGNALARQTSDLSFGHVLFKDELLAKQLGSPALDSLLSDPAAPALLRLTLPQQVHERAWDVIVVEGRAPDGESGALRRMQGVFMASRLRGKETVVLLTSCGRDLERRVAESMLGKASQAVEGKDGQRACVFTGEPAAEVDGKEGAEDVVPGGSTANTAAPGSEGEPSKGGGGGEAGGAAGKGDLQAAAKAEDSEERKAGEAGRETSPAESAGKGRRRR